MKLTKVQLTVLNELLEAVYYHGGDRGGAYDSNTADVKAAADIFERTFNVKAQYKMVRSNGIWEMDGIPFFVEKQPLAERIC